MNEHHRKLTAGPLDATPPNRKRGARIGTITAAIDFGNAAEPRVMLLCNDDGSKSEVLPDGKVFKHETPDALIDAIEKEVKRDTDAR